MGSFFELFYYGLLLWSRQAVPYQDMAYRFYQDIVYTLACQPALTYVFINAGSFGVKGKWPSILTGRISNGGNSIVVFEALQMVVVFTGDYFVQLDLWDQQYDLLKQRIIPAAVGSVGSTSRQTYP